MEKKTRKVGVDIGKSCVKFVSEFGTGEIPSYISRGRLTQVINDPLSPPSAIRYGGTDWILGHDALLGSQFSLKTDETKTDERNLLFILLILARLGITQADIVVGLPVNSTENAKTVELVKGMFSGQKEAVINGKSMTFTTRVNVLPEPLGTYFSLVLDDNCRPIKTSPFYHARMAVIDIGFRTVDVICIQAGRIATVKDSTMSGTVSFFEQVWKLIESDHGMLQWADKIRIFHDITNNPGNATLRANGEYVNPAIWARIADLRAQLAKDIVDEIKSILSSMKPDRMVITGGGGLLLKEDLLSNLRQPFFHPNPRYANALGFYRAAQLMTESS